MKQVEEDELNYQIFKIHQMTTKILSQVINETIAEVLETVYIFFYLYSLEAVDQCIQLHSREHSCFDNF